MTKTVFPFFIVFIFPLCVLLGLEWGGAWTLLTPAVAFVLIPLLDYLLPENTENHEDARGHSWVYDLPVLAWVPVQLGLTGYALVRLSSGEFGLWGQLGVVFAVGLACGAGGINVAHELMHRRSKAHRAAAEILMSSVSYPHFCVEHVMGHHRRVATPDDPATSRFRESFYRFFPRVVLGSLRSAWELEGARCRKKGIPALSLRNRRLRYPLVLAAIYVGIAVVFGLPGVLWFAGQSFVAIALLEVINYLEHYGLERQRLESGHYERVRPRHSWNSPHRVSNWALFNLARHSDHHYLASREYDRLRHHEGAPQLPAGYAGMLLVALVPPLWFHMMDPLVRAWRAEHASPDRDGIAA